MDLFPNIYPERRVVYPKLEPNLVGVMIKSVIFDGREEALLCRGLVVQARDNVYSTVHFRVTGIAPVVGYDLNLTLDQDGEKETWRLVRETWSEHFVADPVHIRVLHDDIKRKVNAQVFPLKCINLAKKYMGTVRGALTFGDFCPDRGYYIARDGNTPALCSDVMFGRVYFIPANKLNRDLSASDLVYDHERSEAEAKLFDGKHVPHFYKTACLDIETVFDKSYQDPRLRCESFAYKFPYCTERTIKGLTEYRNKLVCALNAGRERLPKQSKSVSVPALAPDMPGQQHEITCVSLVILNSHVPKPSPAHHRKKLIVLYNKCKVTHARDPEADDELARGAGVDVTRMLVYPCSGEHALLQNMIQLLYHYGIELLYVYNAEFDVRVIEQRVHFYAEKMCAGSLDAASQKKGSSLLRAWHGLFVTRALSEDVAPFFQFENVRYLAMYKEMLKSLGSALLNGPLTEHKLQVTSAIVEKFNREKAKLGHFKMNSCGMNIIDLYRVAGTREIKFACTSMKLNDVAPFVIVKARELHKKPPKDTRKLYKLADVGYSKMDQMLSTGGKSLFAVLLYNLVDSQLCARLAKVLCPVSALFHRCRTTLNIDVVVHGRGDNFGGFVQSIHSVQMPQLKFALDTLRVKAGPLGVELKSRLRWRPKLQDSENDGDCEKWKGGAVCDPLTGLHYSGPGMGLELSFDFSSMYPSIMCALNISPETTIPWPPVKFPHDLSGWVCYNWEAEGFEYASLILKYDQSRGGFVREPAVLSSSVEYYLDQRAELKRKLQSPDIGRVDRVYCETQEGECKVLANSFYGTAPHPCGPLISGHGRRQISVVNNCVSTFYQHRCPVVYGDTDSVMVSVGYGPEDLPEPDVPDVERGDDSSVREAAENDLLLESFARQARTAMGDKFKRAGAQVPAFLDYVHAALVEDTLERMYVIGRGNIAQKVVRDPDGTFTEEGYPVYVARVPESTESSDVTGPFVKDRRVKLEYENSCSVYCHVAKKTYVALTHTLDDRGELSSVSVKVRGLSAFKSVRSPCDSAVTETFIACVMRGECVKLETDQISCFSTSPWHRLKSGDVILYLQREPLVDNLGRWLDLNLAGSFLAAYSVQDVSTVQLDSGFSAVSTRLVPARGSDSGSVDALTTVRTLYKDGKYCMNHMFSRNQAILRDLLVCKASELIASKMGAGFFSWSSLIKSSKNKHFNRQTLERLRVSNSSVKTGYVEIVRTWLQQITGLSVKPVECIEYHKCNPCEAAFYRYPLDLRANTGCVTAMFGGSLRCEAKSSEASNKVREWDEEDRRGSAEHKDVDGSDECHKHLNEHRTLSSQTELISHPYQPFNKCFANSRVLIAHYADRTLVNRSGKLVAHCIVDYCLPRHMYSSALSARSLDDCRVHLLTSIASVRERLRRANATFNAVMNNCPEHMIPACGTRELKQLRVSRETANRLPGEKLEACIKVITEDLGLRPRDVYENLSASLGKGLAEAMSEGTVSLPGNEDSLVALRSAASISLSVPSVLLTDAGIASSTGKLSIVRSELCERTLVDLAGLLYQTLLMLHIRVPDAFISEPPMYPDSVLCIMPYSCADANLMRTWIETFGEKKWLNPIPAKLGKRTHAFADCRRVTYHCTGCSNFYRDLLANNVPAHRLIRHVYDQDKRRRLGQCVNERRWLS